MKLLAFPDKRCIFLSYQSSLKKNQGIETFEKHHLISKPYCLSLSWRLWKHLVNYLGWPYHCSSVSLPQDSTRVNFLFGSFVHLDQLTQWRTTHRPPLPWPLGPVGPTLTCGSNLAGWTLSTATHPSTPSGPLLVMALLCIYIFSLNGWFLFCAMVCCYIYYFCLKKADLKKKNLLVDFCVSATILFNDNCYLWQFQTCLHNGLTGRVITHILNWVAFPTYHRKSMILRKYTKYCKTFWTYLEVSLL